MKRSTKIAALLAAAGTTHLETQGILALSPAMAQGLNQRRGETLYGERIVGADERWVRIADDQDAAGLSAVAWVDDGTKAPDGRVIIDADVDPPLATEDGVPWQTVIADPQRYRDRVRALPGADRVSGTSVLIIGVGSVGSIIATRLARLGVAVHVIDPDILESHNMIRWGMDLSWPRWIGRRKANAWAEWMRQTTPGAVVAGHAFDVVRAATRFDDVLKAVQPQLLIVATDTRDSRQVANAAAARHGVGALYIALSDAASSVRIEVVEDAKTGPCHRCSSRAESGLEVDATFGRRSLTPYATDDADAQHGVPALPVQVAMGTAMAERVALALLTGEDWRPWLNRGQQTGNIAYAALRPEWWVFDEPWDRFAWLAESDPECPVCGGAEGATEECRDDR